MRLIVILVVVAVSGFLIVDPVKILLGCKSYPCIVRYSAGGTQELASAAAFSLRVANLFGMRRVVIFDGECLSGCPLFADYARSNALCIASGATFGFHKGGFVISDGRGGTMMDPNAARPDPPHSRDIDQFVRARGGYPYSGYTFIYPEQLRRFWRRCTNKDWSG